jgi:hypothetical protein
MPLENLVVIGNWCEKQKVTSIIQLKIENNSYKAAKFKKSNEEI